MDLYNDNISIKDEPTVYFDVCEKEEPDLFQVSESACEFKSELVKLENPNSQTSLFKEDLVASPKIEQHNSELTRPRLLYQFSSNDVKVKQEIFDGCDSFVHSYVFNSSTNDDKIHAKESQEIKQECSIDFQQIFGISAQESEDRPSLFCYYCEFSSKFRGNLTRHIKFQHLTTGSKRFKCSVCYVEFNFRCDLMRHSFMHKGTGKHSCLFCNYTNIKKCYVAKHIFNHHSSRNLEGHFDGSKQCYYCSYKTEFKRDFLLHMIGNHKLKIVTKQNVYPCGLCSYLTPCKHTLIKHIDAYHKKIRPYACHLCDYAANRPSDLRIHLSAKHEKLRPYKCEMCGYSSAYKKHVRRHILSQHINKKIRKTYTKKKIFTKQN